MKTLKTKVISLVLAMCFALSLTGCSSSIDMAEYVSLELESTFHNDHSEDLLAMYGDDTSRADLEEYYAATVAWEAESFLTYFCYSDVSYLSQETYDRTISIFEEIFDIATFEVLEANEIDGVHHVAVKVNQTDALYNGITIEEEEAIFAEVYPTEETPVTPESEDKFVNLYLDQIEEYLPSASTPTTKTVTVLIETDSSGMYTLDIETLDELQAEIIPWATPE